MARTKPKDPIPDPTLEEQSLGNAVRMLTRKFAGTMEEKLDQAARAVKVDGKVSSYTCYTDLPEGVRHWIGTTSGGLSRKRMKETDLVGPARTEEIAEEFRKEHVEKIRTRWEHDIVRVRTLAHALHPKDEAETITSVEAARQENPWTAPKTTTRFRRRR